MRKFLNPDMVLVMVAGTLFNWAAFVQAAPGSEAACSGLLAGSEKSWLAGDYEGSDKFLKQAESLCPDLAEIYWREARNIYDRLEALPREKRPGKQESIKLYEQIISLADKCISLDQDDGMCWHWKGVGIGRRGSTKGVLNSLSDLRELESVMNKAETLKPSYRSENGSANAMGDIYDAHGMLYRIVPDWFILKTLFGVRGDMAKSVEYQRKAVALEPQRIEYNKELGVSLICYGQKKNEPQALAEGRKYLQKIENLPIMKNSDRVDKEHARILLANPDLACGYSRDAQQVQSKEEFEKTQKR